MKKLIGKIKIILPLSFLLLVLLLIAVIKLKTNQPLLFNSTRAYRDVITQVGFGPRIPESAAHSLETEYIQNELTMAGWSVSVQETTWNGFLIKNIISSNSAVRPSYILGAHYDSRMIADQNRNNTTEPVPGANDGASGVAVLLEIARSLPPDAPPVWLVFFDAEDNGGINGREWIMGSRSFASSLDFTPKAVIVLDMVGDKEPSFFYEVNSNTELSESIWKIAKNLGYNEVFIPEDKYSILDDHIPFIELGIPAIDIIDFDYPYLHTTEDTIDKVSKKSLNIIGTTLLEWLMSQN
jgi:glutaminyl-peptide cyclotransferase